MKFVEEIIPELIAQHSCVVVPGFGGFVAKAQPAHIDYEKGIITAPFRAVLFNRQLTSDDGILIHSMATINGSSYDDTFTLVKGKVQEWNSILNSGGRVEIDRLGVFYKDHEGSIRFEQDRFFNLLMESYGLESIRFLPVQEEVELVQSKNEVVEESELYAEKAVVQEKEVAQVVPLKRKSRPYLKYAAAAVLLPIAFYSFWIPVKTDVLESGVLSLKDFNPFYQKKEGHYIPTENEVPSIPTVEDDLEKELKSLPEEIEVYSYKFTSDKYIPVDLEKPNKENVGSDDQMIVEAGAMNFIVGCFANKTNAENLVKELKQNGLPAFIVDEHNGLHRVSAGAALSTEKLEEIKNTTVQLGFKGWVLK